MAKNYSKEKNKTIAVKKENKGKKAREEIKAPKIKAVEQDTQWDIFHTIAFWGLAVLLFLPPYFRGLFFAPEQERALIFAAVVFWFAWLWKWGKRNYNFLSHPMDYFVLAFPLVYLLSAFQAANYSLAVDEVVKTTLYFMVYWLASRLVRNEDDIAIILRVVYISAIGVAMAGLATTTGIININDGFINGRISSTFQYANALASFLAAVAIIGFYLWHRAGLSESEGTAGVNKLDIIPSWLNFNNINQYLYALGNFLLLTVFLGTKSQGGTIVFAVVLILFMIGLTKGDRIPVFSHLVLTGVPSFIAIGFFLYAVDANNMGTAWLWILAGLLLVIAGQALYSFSERKGLLQWIAGHKNLVIAAVLLVVVCGGIGAGVYISGHSDAVKSLVEEIRLRNATERFYFFQDAMKMFIERPVIGWGGGGWEEAYRAYQGYFYNSNEVHGHYFQIMVEVGTIGILVMLGIWISFLYTCHKLYHGAGENKESRLLVLAITVAALSIGGHAVIDFDLSLSALAIVLWVFFGLARGISIYSSPMAVEEKKSKKYIPSNYSVLAAVSVISIIVIFFAGSLAIAGNYVVQAGKNMQSKSLNTGVNLLKKSISYNPLNADTYNNLARVYKAQGKYDDAITEAGKAIKLSKYSAPRYAELASLYLSGKKSSEDAVSAAEKALSLAPFQVNWYELLARTYFTAGYNELAAGNWEPAKQYFEKATDMPDRIEAKMSTLDETGRKLWRDAPMMTVTPAVKLNEGASQYILGKWSEADKNLQAALEDENSKGEASLWLAVLRDKQGRNQEAQEMLDQAQKMVPELAKGYDGLRKLEVLR